MSTTSEELRAIRYRQAISMQRTRTARYSLFVKSTTLNQSVEAQASLRLQQYGINLRSSVAQSSLLSSKRSAYVGRGKVIGPPDLTTQASLERPDRASIRTRLTTRRLMVMGHKTSKHFNKTQRKERFSTDAGRVSSLVSLARTMTPHTCQIEELWATKTALTQPCQGVD